MIEEYLTHEAIDMKQTNSAITMLVKAYRAILTNCFIKNLMPTEEGKA